MVDKAEFLRFLGFEEGVAVFLQGFASTSQRAGEVDFMTGIENVYATVYNDTLSCVQWCKYARKCVGDEMYEHMMEIAAAQKARAAEERAAKQGGTKK